MPDNAATLYGIPNCDTVKRARAWFADQGRDVVFHDFKKAGVPEAELDRWIAAAGIDHLLNRRGTAWRALDAATRTAADADAAAARGVMLAHPSTIRRPVVDWGGGRITVGFDAPSWPPR